MSDDFTPDVDYARRCYVEGRIRDLDATGGWAIDLHDEFRRLIESVRAEERERIARNIEAQGITARDVPQNKDWMAVIHTRKADARIAREGA